MSDATEHHHVPQFLLAGWCRSDGRLAVYSHKHNRVVLDWHTPEHTAYEPRLYTIAALPEDPQWVEREVMSKRVDGPASTVLKQLLAGELSALGSDERSAWGRFMLAQWHRSPERIAEIRRGGRDALIQELERNPEDCLAAAGDDPEPTLLQWVDNNLKGLHEIMTMGRVLPQLINDARAGDIIINMTWQVLDLAASKVDLLTSDRPVTRFAGLNSPDCIIVCPLDPHRLFVASKQRRGLTYPTAEKLVRSTNSMTVREAHARVFGTGSQHMPLVEKYLAQRRAA